ncbi:6352_t:CDS:2 [Funneliformis caledonium]|uniref:6352_t:CDS:1 n=1 Tax=Funneliformis caledonium TaxID=1117310 RepID=A0A9N8ZVX0_9GLOM|nr:6352_t:CDS:2 [Funneliformis caledonium]
MFLIQHRFNARSIENDVLFMIIIKIILTRIGNRLFESVEFLSSGRVIRQTSWIKLRTN